MSKKNIHTVPKQGGGWRNVREDSAKAISSSDTKVEAVKSGRETAKQDKVEHIIHRKDGTIQNKNSYGNDPCPPRDKVK